MYKFKSIIDTLSSLESFYDFIRIINVKSKKVILEKCNGYNDRYKDIILELNCDNVLFLKACAEMRTIIEIKYSKNCTFLLSISPITIQGKMYLVEIIKDITDSGFITNINDGNLEVINKEVHKINQYIITDELTGVYNKRYMNKRLVKDMENNVEDNTCLGVMIIDIDDFKKVNDIYGHVVGDSVLKEFSKLIYENIRKDSDWIARYGGEEFIVVINNIKQGRLYEIGETLRKKIEDNVFKYKNISVKITASFGIKCICRKYHTVYEIIEEADKNLYIAKSLGKNRVIIN